MTTADVVAGTPAGAVSGAALTIRGLSHSYGGLDALRHVSFEVAAGSICAILGPNGAGKSTLASCVAGTLATSPGSVLLNGADISREPHFRRARRGVSYIPEQGTVFPALTVLENIVVGRSGLSRRGRQEAVDQAAAIFPFLGKRAKDRAGMLSGGEQQMLALSRILIQKPALVVVDELSHGLAPAIVEQLFTVVSEFRGSTTFLIIEQYVKRAQEVADDIIVLSYGQLALATKASAVSLDQLEDAYEIQARHPDEAPPAPAADSRAVSQADTTTEES
jgi:branched-chain amino acid transport system ATP-binding protein